MNTHQPGLRVFSGNRVHIPVLVLLTWLGLSVGMAFSVCNSHLTSGISTSAFCVIPTYGCLLAVNVIPIAVLTCFLAFSLTAFCYPFVFLYSVSRGFVGMSFYLALGAGAWLIRLLLCFSGYITSVLMWWLLLRCLKENRRNLPKDACLAFIIICLTTVADFKLIAPFLSGIFAQ